MAEISFKVAVIIFAVVKITFVVAEIFFKVVVITSSVAKITFSRVAESEKCSRNRLRSKTL